MKALNVSPDLKLPSDVVTQAVALVAVRRAGKSNAAAVMAEEMFHAGLPWVAIDPKGDWWGLRSNAAGDGPGLPVPIFGGLHGDLPLLAGSGRRMAELVVERNLTCIIDVSRFSKTARSSFLTDFALRLYELHQADPQPRHIFLEEADRALPQVVRADMAPCVGAWSDLVRLGGAFGLGVTLVSQRCAVINKDALTQVEIMIALRTTSPQDRKAIRDWMEHHAIATEIVESLPSLLSGEAWVSSSFFLPESGHEPIMRMRFRQRATFDSGATPKVGQARPVATLADIDLGALEAQMADVVEKAAQDDPRALRRQIVELQNQLRRERPAIDVAQVDKVIAENRQLRERVDEMEAREPETVEVRVPVLTDADRERLGRALGDLGEITRIIATAAHSGDVVPAPSKASPPPERPPARPRPTPQPPLGPVVLEETAPGLNDPRAPVTARALTKAERTLLGVLAQFPAGRTRIQLALLAHYSAKSSSYSNALGALRSAGLVNRGDPIQITDYGLDQIDGAYEPLPTGEALVLHWMHELNRAERTILTSLLDAYPEALTRDQLAEATGYSASSSSYSNALGRRRSLELVNRGADIRADDQFAREVGRV